MILSITYIALKDYSKIVPFFKSSLEIKKQLRKSNCISYEITGFLIKHYTISLWANHDDMLSFKNGGAHRVASIDSRQTGLALEDCFLLMESEKLLDWKTAKKLLMEEGRFTSSRDDTRK